LHSGDSLFNIKIKQLFFNFWNLKEMDRVLVEIRLLWVNTISELLIEKLSDKWSDACHESGSGQQNIKEDVKTSLLLIVSLFSIDSGSVKSHIPIRQLIQEPEKWLYNVVKLIGLHFVTD